MGLVIVTGPTGSGKSTTLAAMLDYINRHRPCHIVTIEDPIEYVHGNHRSAVSQREVGTDTQSFARALRSVLREDPDVLLVGEMRDLESIATTLTIAETGHLVFATLHTNDSAQAIDRIVDIFPSDRRDQIQVQLASTLEGRHLPAPRPPHRRRPGGRLRGADGQPRRAQPGAGGQDPPAAQRRLHPPARGHADPRDGSDPSGQGRPDRLRDGPEGQSVPEGSGQAAGGFGSANPDVTPSPASGVWGDHTATSGLRLETASQPDDGVRADRSPSSMSTVTSDVDEHFPTRSTAPV